MKNEQKEEIYKIFVYGTLLSGGVRKGLDVHPENIQEATLPGYRKEGLNVIPDQGNKVDGLVLEVTKKELQNLDKYEGLDVGMYYRVPLDIITEEGEKTEAYVYQLSYNLTI